MKHLNAALICLALLTEGANVQAEVAPSIQAVSINMAQPIGGFTDRFGFRRRYYVVPAGLSDAQLTSLGRLLHAKEKDGWMFLLDSDEQAKQLMATVEKTAHGDFSGYPGAWMEQHTVARIVLMLFPNKTRQWVMLKGGSEQQLTSLPCLEKKWCTK